MWKFFAVVLAIPLFGLTQEGYKPGIRFEKEIGWKQVLAKAKKENKYIFLDCSASWCVPCKKMEKEVFPLKNVGDYMNEKFVSVHVQMDTSKTDDENIKAWYTDAHALQQQYKVSSYPTYLFFSPDGRIVHRFTQAMPDSLFLKVAGNALNPDKQYYTLLGNYKAGKKDYSKLSYLANISRQIGEDGLANTLAADYFRNYLNKLSDKELLQKKYLEFAWNYSSALSSNDKLFKLLYKDGSKADEIMKQKDFAKNIVYTVIKNEEIVPRVGPCQKPVANEPDWNGITKLIAKKYNSYYTDLVVVDAQLAWYQQKKDRGSQIRYTVKKIEKYGIDTAGVGWAMFNNVAYDLFFRHCNNIDTLNKVIGWMEMINKDHPDDYPNMDTYANLLYKVGRITEAIEWEEKATALERQAAAKENREPDASYQETLDKMKKGIPTWTKN